MTREQRHLAIADAGFVVFWLLMNFFWMWSGYAVAIPLALPTALFAGALLLLTERSVGQLCASGANVSWFLKDYYWMLENSGRLPSGLWWGTFFFAVTLFCTIIALVSGGTTGTLHDVAERLRRISMLFRRT